MKELIDIIVNVLNSTEKGSAVRLEKKSDSEFLFSGENKDAVGTAYEYEISVKYKIKKEKVL